MKLHSKFFYGNEISEYGQKMGYLDYGTLAKAFDSVLNNSIIQNTCEIGYWEQVSGFIDNIEKIEELRERLEELSEKLEVFIEEGHEEKADEIRQKMYDIGEEIKELEEEQENCPDIYQYYIVSDNGAEILQEINEIVLYNDALDMYVWGVTHWGTSWDYVLTNVKCNVPYEEE